MSTPVVTKWQEFLDKPKGSLTYNPSQTFALHVFWVVRSPTAAHEMIQKGFRPCSEACHKDTPTTLCYLFRISHNQSRAEALRKHVQTIGHHPHYEGAFKSIEMGLPRLTQETKLKMGGIDTTPLSWSKETPMTLDLMKQLDFDPVVLECTEVYLDNQSFYEHAASRDWFKHSPEILKACRSLKPVTYCLGTPDEKIWDAAIEGSLKAIRFDRDREWSKCIRPGVFVSTPETTSSNAFSTILELDAEIHPDKIETWRVNLDAIFATKRFRFMMVLPTNLDEGLQETIHVRLMFAFFMEPNETFLEFDSITADMQNQTGRFIMFGGTHSEGQLFIKSLRLENVVVETADILKEKNELAGYPIHLLHNQLEVDVNKNYQV